MSIRLAGNSTNIVLARPYPIRRFPAPFPRPECVLHMAPTIRSWLDAALPDTSLVWDRLELAMRLTTRLAPYAPGLNIWPGAYYSPYWLCRRNDAQGWTYHIAIGDQRLEDAVAAAMLLAYHIHRLRMFTGLPGTSHWTLPTIHQHNPTLTMYRSFAYLLLDL